MTESAIPHVRRVFGGSAAIFLATLAFFVAGVVRTKLAAHLFGAEGLGAFGQLSQIQTVFVGIGGAGVATASRVLVSRGGGREVSRHLVSALLWGPVLVATVLTLVLLPALPTLARVWLGDATSGSLVFYALAGSPFVVVSQVGIAVTQARGERWRLIGAAAASALVGTGVVAILMTRGSLDLAVATLWLSPLVQALAVIGICPDLAKSMRRRPIASRTQLREVWQLTWASALLGVMASLGEAAARATIVHSRNGLVEVAFYLPVTFFVIQLMSMLLSALATSSMVEFGSDLSRRAIWRKTTDLVAAVVPVVVTACLALTATSGLLVPLFFSSEVYTHSYPNLVVAMMGEPLRCVAWVVGASLLPRGLTRAWMLLGLLSVAIQAAVGVSLALAGLGSMSLALGLLSGSVFSGLANLWYARRTGVIIRLRIVGLAMLGTALISVGLLVDARGAEGAIAAALLAGLVGIAAWRNYQRRGWWTWLTSDYR